VKKLERLAFPVVTAYLWVMMILLGAVVLETFMIYPNVISLFTFPAVHSCFKDRLSKAISHIPSFSVYRPTDTGERHAKPLEDYPNYRP
jgi:hypothetical protein